MFDLGLQYQTSNQQTKENEMYRVTAMYEDSEVGYGEGDTYEYAAREAAESVSGIYLADDVMLCCTHGVMEVKTPLSLWLEFCE